jgi:hypothetical protein
MLAVLHKHPHDSFELDGAEYRFSFVTVGLKGQFLRPPGELFAPNVVFSGDRLSHVLEDSGHYVLSRRRHDRADEDVFEGFQVCFGLVAGAFPL